MNTHDGGRSYGYHPQRERYIASDGRSYYEVLAAWNNHPNGLREEVRAYRASSLGEALMMAERADAGRAHAPDTYGILPEDFDLARAEGIDFNEADGLLI